MARLKRLVVDEDSRLFRVVPAASDPLDVSHSVRRGGRWNPAGAFPTLYTCCSLRIARAIVQERLRRTTTFLVDLESDALPRLSTIGWAGPAVDVATAPGVTAAGLPATYPADVAHATTQPLAAAWHQRGEQGVLCRSATLGRAGFKDWTGDHRSWAELAVFTQNAHLPPSLLDTDDTGRWLDDRTEGAPTVG